MTTRPNSSRFLDRLRSLVFSGDDQRMERVLAATRAALAACSLVAVYIDSPEPTEYVRLADGLLIVYAVYSLVLVVLAASNKRRPTFGLIVHGIDMIWPAAITLFTAGPNSPFFLFFLFVLVSAAHRWGFRETMLTGATTSIILLLEGTILSLQPKWTFIEGAFEMNRFIVRSTYVLVLAFLLGYLAEEEKQLRAQASVVARVGAGLRAERGLRGNIERVLDDTMRVFGSNRALLAVQEVGSGRVFAWEARRSAAKADLALHFQELEFSQRPAYFFGATGQSWHMVRSRSARHGRPFDTVCIDAEGKLLRDLPWTLPENFLAAHPFDSLLGTCSTLGEEWSIALFFFEPAMGASRETEVRFLQMLMQQVGPAAYSVYLFRRLRSRAGAMERARVARELHDGVLQSLIALEMQVDVLRRTSSAGSNGWSAELGPIQESLHREILNVRELMQQMKPVELRPNQFLDFLADAVQRFQRETGISARFVTELEEVSLSPRVGRELARIVQEALVNIRKHSTARNVLVRFAHGQGDWKLLIEDDGRGFDFSGRLSFHELNDTRRGPAIIKERLRSIQGELAIESSPGHGARLEITIPQKAYG